VEVESPRKYFSRPSLLRVRVGRDVVFEQPVADDLSLRMPVAATVDRISIETDQTYVPAERSRRTKDRRHLGLRIFRCELTPAFSRDR